MENVVAIIPARMGSSRFPGKPLVPIRGLPMIEHVRRRVRLSRVLHDVVVATCDEAIRQAVEAAGGKAVMTADTHERCTDRVAEAAAHLDATIVVNVQGDEPLIQPRMVDEVVEPLLKDPQLPCSNLMVPITDQAEFENVNTVKTVFNAVGDMLYCSRLPVPYAMKKPAGGQQYRWKQLGIIAFRSAFLQEFARLSPTPLEQLESVDMMRAVEHGYRVRMVETQATVVGVDVPGDVQRVEAILATDPLVKEYM